ncbi:MAG: pentapeptide repeat-containing protein, partial [Sandaracinaceae bacterium]|nr:pentapeptide repeat-containing protein [Sandaracinaceae bacterium]
MTEVIDTREGVLRALGRAEGLHDVIVRGVDLRGVDLSARVLREACFFRCDLRAANLRAAQLRNVLFAGCDLTEASLEGVRLTTGLLRLQPDGEVGTRLDRAALTGAELASAIFDRVGLVEADFTSARLESAELTDCDLTGARLTDAMLELATLRR